MCVFLHAVQVVATKAQLAKAGTGLHTIISDVLREEGLLGLFRGFRASLLLCVNPAINFTVFEQVVSFPTHLGG